MRSSSDQLSFNNSYTIHRVLFCLAHTVIISVSLIFTGLIHAEENESLSPTGAEVAANSDGSIPEWDGGLKAPPNDWDPKHGYSNPYASEVPINTITSDNLDEHSDKLTPGLIALLQNRKSFEMPVYPTHRSFANPESVYAATKKHSGEAQVSNKQINNHTQPALPFPLAKTGEEVMLNHLNRWIGGTKSCSDWFPIRSNGDYYRVGWCSTIIQAINMDKVKKSNDSTYFLGRYDAPSTLNGTIYLVHETYDKSKGGRRAWIYNSGQRRVRRAPDLAYDNIGDGSEGMVTIDDGGGFNGSLDRYDWKLVGKREVYIPYNAYQLADPALRYKDMFVGSNIKPELMRYELHRVWEVEAKLSPGMSHVYYRRNFYLDEDSWQIVMTEAYDSRDELWRVSLLPLIQLYDVPTMIPRANLNFDLIDNSLFISGLDNERKQPSMEWNIKGRIRDFKSSALRAN